MANRNFPQLITYWAIDSYNGSGDFVFEAPVTIYGRWEEKQEVFRDRDNAEVLSRSIVYVESDVVVDGFLALGDATAFSSPLDAGEHVRQIKQFNKSPDLRANEYFRKAFLQ